MSIMKIMAKLFKTSIFNNIMELLRFLLKVAPAGRACPAFAGGDLEGVYRMKICSITSTSICFPNHWLKNRLSNLKTYKLKNLLT